MTKKPTSAAAARRATRMTTGSRGALPELPVEVADRILSYRPQRIDAAAWDVVRPVVVEIVVRSAPSSADRAQHRLLPVAKLAVWAHSSGVPLDAATLLSERVVEEWARSSIAAGEPKSSVATYRSILRTVATAVTPDAAAVKSAAAIPRTAGAAPYTSAEELALRRAMTGQRTAVYRATGCLLYGLSRGAGLASTDLRKLRTHHVTDTAEGIAIEVGGRTVWVLEGFCDIVRVGLAVDRGDGWLLAGRNGQRRNIGEYIDRFTVPAGTPRLNLARCRATWILDHLNRGTPIAVIRDALGTNGIAAIERVLAYVDPVDDTTRAALLRGAP